MVRLVRPSNVQSLLSLSSTITLAVSNGIEVNKLTTSTYKLSKFLKNILSPLVGNTVYNLKNFAEFVELIEKINILYNESQVSFDIVSLFTSIPLETARAIVLDRLSNDCTLEDRTNLTITESTEALDISLTSTYFTYNNKCYEQNFGTPMGSKFLSSNC